MIWLAMVTGLVAPQAAPSPDPAPGSLAQLESRMIDAVGGEEAWRSVTSLKLIGIRNRNGYEMGLVTWLARPNRVRVERTLRGMKQIIVFDGDKGWLKDFREEAFAPAEEADTRETLDEVEKYLRWPDRGLGEEARLEGTVERSGGTALQLLVPSAGESETWFVDRESGQLLEIVEARTGEEGESYEVHSFFFDERLIDGLRFPFYVEVDHGTGLYSFEVSSIEVNPDLESGLFAPDDGRRRDPSRD